MGDEYKANGMTDVNNTLCVLDHLDLSLVVRPSIVPKDCSDLLSKIKELLHDRNVNPQPIFVAIICLLARLGNLGEFELCHRDATFKE